MILVGLDYVLRDKLSFQWAILVVSLLSLVCLLFVSLSKASFIFFDAEVNGWAASIQTSSFTPVAVIIDFVFDTPALLCITLFVALFLFIRGYRGWGLVLVGAMLGDAVIIALLKITIPSVRPLNGLLLESDFSFPSGHASSSVVFCGLLTYYVWQRWGSLKVEVSSTALSAGIMSFVGFDRIYLNVHWFSDVLGGYLLGIFWLMFSIALFQYWNKSGRYPSMRPISRIQLFSRWIHSTSCDKQ